MLFIETRIIEHEAITMVSTMALLALLLRIIIVSIAEDLIKAYLEIQRRIRDAKKEGNRES